MERAVARGHMAPAEFHCKKAELMESLASGVDDGRTRTQGMFLHVLQPQLCKSNTDTLGWILYQLLFVLGCCPSSVVMAACCVTVSLPQPESFSAHTH